MIDHDVINQAATESGAFQIIALVVSFVAFCFWVAFFL